MKFYLCFLLLAAASVYGQDEKKNEKRGVLGVGYGLPSAPLIGHGGVWGAGGLYGGGLYGHGLLGAGALSPGLLGHGVVAPAPLLTHAPLALGSPLLPYGAHGLGALGGLGWH